MTDSEATRCAATAATAPSDRITARVQTLLRERFDLGAEQLVPDRPLEELGIDSLAAIELLFDLEQEFDITFSDERSPIRTICDVAVMVERELATKAAAA